MEVSKIILRSIAGKLISGVMFLAIGSAVCIPAHAIPQNKTQNIASAQRGASLTPAEVMKKVVAPIASSSNVQASFTASAGGHNVSGTLKSSDSKFAVTTPESSVWFDGKTMWTANHATKETTITVPDAAEIAATNPLAYIRNYNSDYRLFFSKRKTPEGKWLVLLNPKKGGTGVKAVEVTVDKASFTPERLIIRNDDDSVIQINITKLSHNVTAGPSDFVYPAAKYSSYEVVDLR